MPRSPADIPVVILCGGLGTRIREAAESLPKPLIDIGGRPILWHIMKVYDQHGFRRFILPLGYKGWNIKEYFLRYRENLADFCVRLGDDDRPPEYLNDLGLEEWEVTLVETGLHTGTGGRVRRVSHLLDGDTFAVTYGDGIADVDLTAELDFHRRHGQVGTVVGVQPTSRYGELVTDDDRVTGFAEKPDQTDTYVSGGFFFFQRDFLDHLTDDPELLLERAPLAGLAASGGLRLFPHHGFWMGMDTYREYTALNAMWESGEAPWKTWTD
jgi:glucose-1-phosphate cytidylyltransferase